MDEDAAVLVGLMIIGTIGFSILLILSKLFGWGWIE